MDSSLATKDYCRRNLLIFFFIITYPAASVFAQTSQPSPNTQTPAATPSPTPLQSKSPPPLEKKLFKNILHDQAAIWTSPLHLQSADAKWLLPLGLSTAALFATDQRTAFALRDKRKLITASHAVSFPGSGYGSSSIAAAFYFVGLTRHDARARETGLLAAEALIDGGLVSVTLKGITGRQRPLYDNSHGEFFDGGTSFPSGHSIAVWSLAAVISDEYKDHRLMGFGAYGLATAVSVARYTGRNHFLSDALVGGAIGYGIGHYVYRTHHNAQITSLSEPAENPAENNATHSKFFPLITPRYDRQKRNYGISLIWGF